MARERDRCPRPVFQAPDTGPESVLLDAVGLSSSTSGRVRKQTLVSSARISRQDAANAAAVSDTARPDLMTASTT